MPTYYIGRFKVRFYSNDHPPAHVHCVNEDGTVIIDVETGSVRAKKGGIKAQDVTRALNLVEEHRELLLAKWEAFDKRRRSQS